MAHKEYGIIARDKGQRMALGGDGTFNLNDRNFAQLCRVAGVSKDTVNRLTPETADRVFFESISNGR